MKYKEFGLLLLFVSSVVVCSLLFTILKYDNPIYAQEKTDTPFGAITSTHSLVEHYTFDEQTTISKIRITLATYARVNTCEVNFCLYKGEEEVYKYVLENASELPDNRPFLLENINVTCESGEDIWLLITSPNAVESNAITVWMKSNENTTESYIYNFQTASTEIYQGRAQTWIYEEEKLLVFLNRNFKTNSYIPCIILGILFPLILLLVIKLIPFKVPKNRVLKFVQIKR